MYGTSKFDHTRHQYDMFVAKLADMNEAGLSQATCFRFDRVLWLPWCEEFFEARKGYPTPVIGSLSERSKHYLRTLGAMRKQMNLPLP